MERISKEDARWWNKQLKEVIFRNKDAHKVLCMSCTMESKNRYKRMKKQRKQYQKQWEREGCGGA